LSPERRTIFRHLVDFVEFDNIDCVEFNFVTTHQCVALKPNTTSNCLPSACHYTSHQCVALKPNTTSNCLPSACHYTFENSINVDHTNFQYIYYAICSLCISHHTYLVPLSYLRKLLPHQLTLSHSNTEVSANDPTSNTVIKKNSHTILPHDPYA